MCWGSIPLVILLMGLAMHCHGDRLAVAQPPTQADELKLFQGTWRGFVVEGRGENPNRGPLELELTVKGNTMSAFDVREKKSLGEGTFMLDPNKKLKEITATGSVNMARSRTYKGIYELNGDTLRWCVDNINQGPPTEFISRRGQFLLILKRVPTGK